MTIAKTLWSGAIVPVARPTHVAFEVSVALRWLCLAIAALAFGVPEAASAQEPQEQTPGDSGAQGSDGESGSADETATTDAATSDAAAPVADPPADPVSPARADAERRYAVAVERADAGDCELAIAEFEEIYRLLENPIVFFNMAVCYEELHQYDAALSSYQRYLDEAAPDAESRGEVERSLRRLEGFLGTIQVTANVTASVWIDDREVGQSPGTFRIPAGSHVVELRASGYESAQQEVVVASGRSADLEFALDELAEEYGGLGAGFFWTSSILAVASLGATAVLGLKALGARDDYNEMLAVGIYESALLEDERQRVRRFSLATDVMIGVTAVFATAAVVFAFLTDWGSDDTRASARLQLRPAAGRQSAGLLLEGAF